MLAWGCSCGRVSDPSDRFCGSCGAAASKGEPLRDEKAKRAFLARAEADDAAALRGVRKVLRDGEKSYREVEAELDTHALGDYQRFDGWFGRWLRGGTGRVDHLGCPIDDSGWDGYGDDFQDFDDV